MGGFLTRTAVFARFNNPLAKSKIMLYSHSKMIGAVAMTAMVLFGSLAVADDAKQPVGTVSIQEKELGFIIGGSKGSGTLKFKGEEHSFKLKGISVGDDADIALALVSLNAKAGDRDATIAWAERYLARFPDPSGQVSSLLAQLRGAAE
jgi:hypothetical protein